MTTLCLYQIVTICGDWYVRKNVNGHYLYFAGYDYKGRVQWSPYFNFTLCMSFERAIKVCDDVRGRRL